MLLLLAIVAGNLAMVTLNKATIDDIEAVAEWRIDKDADGPGIVPDMSALVTTAAAAGGIASWTVRIHHPGHPAAPEPFNWQATRAPPRHALA